MSKKSPIREAKHGFYRDETKSLTKPRPLTELIDSENQHVWIYNKVARPMSFSEIVEMVRRRICAVEIRNGFSSECIRDDGFKLSVTCHCDVVELSFRDENMYLIHQLNIPVPRFL